MSSFQAHANFRRTLHTAGCIIIGDEVLGGKTRDTNSDYLAKTCFRNGISLSRIEVIPDDEADIIESVKRMSSKYDLVITSGGIGPTHDDITYSSMSKAFGLPLKLHAAARARMQRLAKPHPSQPDFDWDADPETSPALKAKLRMVELPHDESIEDEQQCVFVADDLWVPVAIVNGNVHILPGVPRLFEKLVDGLVEKQWKGRTADPNGQGTYRVLFETPLAESEVAGYLTQLASKVESKGVKVGRSVELRFEYQNCNLSDLHHSYPRFGKSFNTVTLVGRDKEYIDSLIAEVEKGVQGRRVTVEGENDDNTPSA